MKKMMMIAAMALISAAAFAQPKFAHVNFSELVQLMPEMDSARVHIETAQKDGQETYQAMVEEFQSKYTQFEQKQATWTPSVKASKERELAEINTRIQDFEQAFGQEIQQLQNQLMAPIYQKAQETVSNIAKASGYIFVFDASSVLYVDETQSTNITMEARRALNISDDKTLEALQAELQAKAAAQQGGM